MLKHLIESNHPLNTEITIYKKDKSNPSEITLANINNNNKSAGYILNASLQLWASLI